jgi:hypothetical protein
MTAAPLPRHAVDHRNRWPARISGIARDAARLPDAELVVFENSARTVFDDEQDRYLAAVHRFLDRISG